MINGRQLGPRRAPLRARACWPKPSAPQWASADRFRPATCIELVCVSSTRLCGRGWIVSGLRSSFGSLQLEPIVGLHPFALENGNYCATSNLINTNNARLAENGHFRAKLAALHLDWTN